MKGIGKAMLDKVAELLATGGLQQERDALADPVNAALKLFTSIHGVGPVMAKKLVHESGYRTLEDLHGAHLPAQARLGIKHFEDSQHRIPFDEVEEHLDAIKRIIARHVDPRLAAVVCGSHRRLQPTSGDVDVLLTHPASHSTAAATYAYVRAMMTALREQHYVVDTLVEGPTKFMGYVKLPHGTIVRRLDVRWIPFDSFFPALLYFTGSDMFNIAMRAEAVKTGYTLNEYHLQRVADDGSKTALEVSSEREIFDILKQPYRDPMHRSK
jgi:DNA polymerase/3'-5' exonuclease PolX